MELLLDVSDELKEPPSSGSYIIENFIQFQVHECLEHFTCSTLPTNDPFLPSVGNEQEIRWLTLTDGVHRYRNPFRIWFRLYHWQIVT